MNRQSTLWSLLAAALLLGACGGQADNGDADDDDTVNVGDKQLAYLNIDSCHENADQATCEAQAANGCRWASAELACPEGVKCPAGYAGFCYAPDPCAGYENEAACLADTANGCAWSAISALSPAGSRGVDGACFRAAAGGDDCVCACPMWCPAEGDCPSCECDCAPKGGDTGGGACTCACPACAPGEACPECTCDCMPGGGDTGCVDDGTCTCACPECLDSADCPACECSCGAAGGGAVMPMMGEGATTCACPECLEGEPCPACDCGGADPVVDPCIAYADEAGCSADKANGCAWFAMGMPCMEGMPCQTGVCQTDGSTGGGNCVCACPACAPGEACPPCNCDCGGGGAGGGAGCTPGGSSGGSSGSGTAGGDLPVSSN